MKKKLGQLFVIIKRNPFTVALIIFAAALHLIIVLPSGSHYCFNGYCGDYFWGVHEHDAIWHIAVSESAFKTFPPRNPIYEGSILSGYNAILDFILFLFALVGIPPLITFFKILPLLWFFLFTYLMVQYGKSINKSKTFIFTFLFLSYFGASFSFIIPFIKTGTIVGTSSLLAMQAVLTLTNIQLAFSYVIMLLILMLLHKKKTSKRQLLTLCLLIFIQWGLKFYAGFISTVIIGVVFFLRWIRGKESRYIIYVLLISICSFVSLFVNYNPFGQLQKGTPFIFKPFALVWPLIEDPSMFYSYYWSNAKYTLLTSSKISPRLLLMMGTLTLLYVVLNLGPRVIGFISLIKKTVLKKSNDIDSGILIGIIFSLIFTIFFIQRGVWWNTVQFLFLVFFLLNIYTAESIASIYNKSLRTVIILGLIIISIPYTFDAIKSYTLFPGVMNVPDSEKIALNILKNLPDGVVYTPLYKPDSDLNSNNIAPLYNHVDSAYVSAYTGKQTLYGDYTQLILLNVDFEGRREQIIKGDCSLVTKIDYIYIQASQYKDLFFKKCIHNNKEFEQIFTNTSTLVYSKIK